MEHRNYESVKYSFTPDELRELGEVLARETQALLNLRDEKKEAMSGFNARIKETQDRVADLAAKINNSYELRDVECLHVFDTPRPGVKRIIRLDTNETVREEPMTMQEMQGSFDFQGE